MTDPLSLIAIHFGCDISPDDELVADLECDPLDIVEMALMMEEAFDIEISDAAMEGWARVDDVVRTAWELMEVRHA